MESVTKPVCMKARFGCVVMTLKGQELVSIRAWLFTYIMFEKKKGLYQTLLQKPINANPGLFCRVWDYSKSKLKEKSYKTQSYKTEINIQNWNQYSF